MSERPYASARHRADCEALRKAEIPSGGSRLNYLSLFSGIEAASVAWGPLGWSPIAFAEVSAFPSAVLAHHYPEVKNHGDITRFDDWPAYTPDLIVGGSPCQAFSVAGLRKGFADPRGNLTLVYLAVVARYRPRWIVWENVPGVLSHDRGRTFGAFVGALGQLGYGWAYRVLDAQYVRVDSHARAVPQRRRRVILVGCAGDQRSAAAVLFEPESLSGHSPPRRETTQKSAAASRSGAARGCGQCGTDVCRIESAPVSALTASGVGTCGADDNQAQAGHLIVVPQVPTVFARPPGEVDFRESLLVAHTLRGEGFDASEDGSGRGTPIIPVPFQEAFGGNNTSGPIEVSTACNAQGGTGRMDFESETFIAEVTAFSCKDDGRDAAGDGSPRQSCEWRWSGRDRICAARTGRGAQAEVHGDGSTIGALRAASGGSSRDYIAFDCKAGGNTGFAVGEIAGTLRGEGFGGGHAAVAWTDDCLRCPEVAQPVRTNVYNNSDPAMESSMHILQGARVRRLTPVECERLQGFPDGWTDIPISIHAIPSISAQRPADRWKQAADGRYWLHSADGPRYKAIGNSMAVNVMSWVGRRIALVDAELRETEQAARQEKQVAKLHL